MLIFLVFGLIVTTYKFFAYTACINACITQLYITFRCFSKDWDVTEYGVCELADIISEIPDTTICLSQQDNEMVICIPKRGMSMYFFYHCQINCSTILKLY